MNEAGGNSIGRIRIHTKVTDMKSLYHNLLRLVAALAALGIAITLTSCGEDEHHEGDGHDHSEKSAHHDDDHDDDHEGHTDGDDDHDHAEKIAGPNGGRVITDVEPHLEFLVLDDRKVKITALDDDNKPATIAGQTVKLTGGDRSSPTRMTFVSQDGVLLSNEAFPEGNDFPVVLQIKSGDGKPVMAKFNLNFSDCPTCDFKEYACVCDHGDHDDHDGHDHSKDKAKE
tara:strand:- start:26 stop:709 length:684 start_codon:yes stop_codon:yes gene_type:complete